VWLLAAVVLRCSYNVVNVCSGGSEERVASVFRVVGCHAAEY
jgi:hypothetical protein